MRRRLGWMHIGYVAIANACWLAKSTPVPDSRTNRHGHLKGMRFPIDLILVCIRCYAAYPLSYRHLEEMMQERCMLVDNSSINRWAIRFLPLIEKISWKYKRPVGGRWRMGETYVKVKGVWKNLYRAVGRQDNTFDFLLTAKRDMAAAKRFFYKVMGANGAPEKVAMDKRGANKAAIGAINAGRSLPILVTAP